MAAFFLCVFDIYYKTLLIARSLVSANFILKLTKIIIM